MGLEKELSNLGGSSTLPPSPLTYWEIRKAIFTALELNDDVSLSELEEAYPKVFYQVVAQARNATRWRK